MDKSPYLVATRFIDCEEPAIKHRAHGLTAGAHEEADQAQRLFYFVRDRIRYNIYAPRSSESHFRASYVLKSGEGYCVQKALLLVALARAVSIPARLRFAEIKILETARSIAEKRGSNIFPYHGLADLLIDGRWVKATPTYDVQYCKKVGIAPVEFDGRKDALLPLLTLDGKPNIEYILDRGFFADLPLEEIRRASVSWKYLKS